MARRLLLCVLVWCSAAARGVPVEKWVETSQSDFGKGQAKGVSILTLGQLALAPDLKPLVPDAAPHIWALAVDAKGAVYAATGTQAKLLRLTGAKVETVFTSPVKTDIEVLAVAVGADGAVYASAAPSGTLYRIAPDGKAEALYKGEEPYIWSLAVAPDGTVYAATGPNGKLLKITPKGKATAILSAGSRHLLSLLLAPDGSVYAGSDKDGLLYHVSPKGEARLAYDAEEADIRAMTLDSKGRLYFATAGTAHAAAGPTTPTPAGPPTTSRTFTIGGHGASPDAGDGSDGSGTPSPRPMPTSPSSGTSRPSGGNAIYRLMPDGDVVKVAGITGAAFYSLLWHKDRLYAGTGNDGRLYCIEGNQIARLANLDESQITAFAVAQGRVLLATANSGRVYELAADHAATGTLISQVHDSQTHSRWGVVNWDARVPPGASVTIATRSGNAATPDDTWSPWSAELSRAEGDHIPSPSARFIQYRATLKANRAGQSPVLEEVVVSYAQSNRRPVVAQVQIQKPPKPRRPVPMPTMGGVGMPVSLPSPLPGSPGGKKRPESPRGPFADTVRISWQASDSNKDELVYAVYFRGEDETTWKKLQDRLQATFCDWDTHAVPDGPFRIRVVASDSPTNPTDQAQEGERVTEVFLVDNTPPVVTDLAARVAKDRTLTVTAKCSDAGSGLDEGEYSIDGGDWMSIVPVDRIFDGQAEALDFKVPALAKGEHTLVVRAKDQAENTGAAKCVLTIE
ncbi:MAG TPA: hypothetical protein VNE39_10940 [Planctomycetota bacterium]|nr:hypothetical protein [Planctomycetota bacterium]